MTERRWYCAGVCIFLLFALWSLTPGARFMLAPGAALAAWCSLYGGCGRLRDERLRKALRGTLAAAGVLLLVLFLIIEGLIFSNVSGDQETQARAGLIFGAGVDGDIPSASLRVRLEAGLRWWQEDPSRVLIVSGGRGNGENDAEGAVMARWLLERGVPEHCLRVETLAMDTERNVMLSAPFLAELVPKGGTVAVISNEFHLYRCKTLVQRLGYQARGVPAATPYLYLKITYCLREFCSVLLMWLGL